MRDETHDREYQQGRDHLNDGIDHAISTVAKAVETTFRLLHAIQFAAPWVQQRRRRQSDVGCA